MKLTSILLSLSLGVATSALQAGELATASTRLAGNSQFLNQENACTLLCGKQTKPQPDDKTRFRIDEKGYIWFWHPVLKKWYYSSRLGHVGSKSKPLHISQFFEPKASHSGCLDEYPGYGWGMFHFCLKRDGIALIQDEAVGGYKGRGTVAYAWAN